MQLTKRAERSSASQWQIAQGRLAKCLELRLGLFFKKLPAIGISRGASILSRARRATENRLRFSLRQSSLRNPLQHRTEAETKSRLMKFARLCAITWESRRLTLLGLFLAIPARCLLWNMGISRLTIARSRRSRKSLEESA